MGQLGQVWANSLNLDQTAPMLLRQSDPGIHCFPFYLHLLDTLLQCQTNTGTCSTILRTNVDIISAVQTFRILRYFKFYMFAPSKCFFSPWQYSHYKTEKLLIAGGVTGFLVMLNSWHVNNNFTNNFTNDNFEAMQLCCHCLKTCHV